MPNTPLVSARYPSSSSAPNANQDIQNLGLDLEDGTWAGPFASTTARDTAFNNWVALGNTMRDGLHCHVTGTGDQIYLSGAWVTIAYNNYKVGGGTVTPNGSGDITVTHNLGTAPSSVLLVSRTAGVNGGHVFAVTGATSTTFTARVYYNNAAMTSGTLGVYWRVDA